MRAALLCIPLWFIACNESAPDPTRAAAPVQALDPRVEALYDKSMARGPYQVDLADVTPILVETLRTGGHEPLRRAKMELAQGGEKSLEAVRRFVDRYRSDPEGPDYLRNAADVLSLSPLPAATPLLASLIDHPSESLRIQVLRGLLVHPRPESFEPALGLLASAPEGYRDEICGALAKLDLERAQRLWLSWIENGDNTSLWQAILPYMSTIRAPDLVLRVRELLKRGDLDTMARIWLCAAACHGGDVGRDEEALAHLIAARESKNLTERDLAVRALAAADRLDQLGWTLSNDPWAPIRAMVVRAAAERVERPDARLLLEQASQDVDELVRRPALKALADVGRADAVDQALTRLSSPTLAELESAVKILGAAMRADPALAQRVWGALAPQLDTYELRAPVERAMLVKILGQIPVLAATQRLIAMAREAQGELETIRAQRFLLRQCVNAGSIAQGELLRLWGAADDPVLRMDAIEAFSALGGDHTRELLLTVLDSPRTTPQELVFVADRLVRIGPASEVAWQLKRAALRMDDSLAREALQGILWRWYPPPPKNP